MKKEKHYLVYKVTNKFDGKFYIGVHMTHDLDDRYMGSGTEIKEMLKKYGRKSFVKEILHVYDNKEDMLAKEKEIVTKEFCKREDTYNRIEGGGTYKTEGMATVKDKDGNCFLVYQDDPRLLSGELVGATKGSNSLTKYFEKYPEERERYRKFGIENMKKVNKDGKCKLARRFTGKIHKEESKKKIGLANSVKQAGEANSQFGTCWVTNDQKNKKIKKEELVYWSEQGWKKGRCIKKKAGEPAFSGGSKD